MEHIFVTHDPQWREVDDVKLALSIFKKKTLWYRSGRWSGKIVQNISYAMKNNTVLSLNTDCNPHIDLFKNRDRRMGLVVVFTCWTPGPDDKPSWCSSVINNTIKSGIPLITRNPVERGWVLSWGPDGDDRQEKIFNHINELGEFIDQWTEYEWFANKVDWINEELNLNLFEDSNEDYITTLKDLTESQFKDKLNLAKSRLKDKIMEEAEKKEQSKIQFYDPVMTKLRRRNWVKKKAEENEKILDTEETKIKPKKTRTRKLGKMTIHY